MSIERRLARIEQCAQAVSEYPAHEEYVAVMARGDRRADIDRRLSAGDPMADDDWKFLLEDREQKQRDREFWERQHNPEMDALLGRIVERNEALVAAGCPEYPYKEAPWLLET